MERILVAVDGLTEEQKQRIRGTLHAVGEVEFVAEAQPDWGMALRGVGIVFGWPEARALAHSEVRFHQLPSSGCDAYLALADEFKHSFVLANARGVCARAVAEHGMAMMFAFARRLPLHIQRQSDHCWERAATYDRLFGATLCLIGMGAIGSTLAAMARALGMRVVAVTRHGSAIPEIDESYSLANLNQALAIADHVAITLPSLPGNRVLMGAPEFAAMKQGSYLYSLGRGSHVDSFALRTALQAGQLAGAGLDVFCEEPLPVADPLWDEPNVLISPHAAGRFTGEMEDLVTLFVDNAVQFAQGGHLQNVVIGWKRDRNQIARAE